MNSMYSLAEPVLLGISLCSSDVAWEAPIVCSLDLAYVAKSDYDN